MNTHYSEIPTVAACAGRMFTRLVAAELNEERWIEEDLMRDKRLAQWTKLEKQAAIAYLLSYGLIVQDDCQAYVPQRVYFGCSKEDVADLLLIWLTDQLLEVA